MAVLGSNCERGLSMYITAAQMYFAMDGLQATSSSAFSMIVKAMSGWRRRRTRPVS